MEDIQIIQCSPELSPYIKQYWFLKTNNLNQIQSIIPTGCISIYFHRDQPLFSFDKNSIESQAYIKGQSTTASNIKVIGDTDMLCVDFTPIGAKLFTKHPMTNFKSTTIDLEALDDKEITRLYNQIRNSSDNKHCIRLIEAFFKKRLSTELNTNFGRISTVVRAVNTGIFDINKLADTCCLGYKQFKRVFSEHIGINPKEFTRIIRFQKALYLLQISPQKQLTEIAHECGYYDQAHFIKEFKACSDLTPTEFINTCNPYSDYFS